MKGRFILIVRFPPKINSFASDCGTDLANSGPWLLDFLEQNMHKCK